MGNLGWFIMLVCFISFMQWHDQNNAAQEFTQGRTNIFLVAKAAAASSPSPLSTNSNKLKSEHRKLSEYCMSRGECGPLPGDCPDGCQCIDVRCTKTVGSSFSPSTEYDYEEYFCRDHRCYFEDEGDACPDSCFCGIHMCAPSLTEI